MLEIHSTTIDHKNMSLSELHMHSHTYLLLYVSWNGT